MPAGRTRYDSGMSTDARAAGTWLRIRNRLTSQLTAPALSKIADVPNSAAPRPATSPAVRALGTRAGRFSRHNDLSEFMAAGLPTAPYCGQAPPAGCFTVPRVSRSCEDHGHLRQE